jgi:hypothetical protein
MWTARETHSRRKATMTGDEHSREVMSFEPHSHDVRISQNGWVYWVRGVKRSEPLRSDRHTVDFSGVGGLILSLLLGWALEAWWERQTTWKVGVLRYKDSVMGGRIKLLFKEALPSGEQPGPRIAELADKVRSGAFDHTP